MEASGTLTDASMRGDGLPPGPIEGDTLREKLALHRRRFVITSNEQQRAQIVAERAEKVKKQSDVASALRTSKQKKQTAVATELELGRATVEQYVQCRYDRSKVPKKWQRKAETTAALKTWGFTGKFICPPSDSRKGADKPKPKAWLYEKVDAILAPLKASHDIAMAALGAAGVGDAAGAADAGGEGGEGVVAGVELVFDPGV